LAPVRDRRIEASIKLIESVLEEKVTAGDFAARVGLSRSRFEHVFKAHTGVAFRRYVQAMRLARVRVLLHDPRLRVKEIASRCGYAQTSDLDREFRREFGLSPSDYRRSTSG